MGYIYTVSDNYLETMYEQTQQFKYIDVIGYRSIKKATSRLHLTNSKDILGYLIIDDDLPSFNDLMRFIRKVELILDKNKILLLVIRNEESYSEFLNQYRGSLVNIRSIVGFEVLNDNILRNAIGTIYSSQVSPYMDLESEDDIILPKDPNYLKYEKLIPSNITDLICPVKKLRDRIETEKFDPILSRIRNKDSFEYAYRTAFIQRAYGKRYQIRKEYPYDDFTNEALKYLLKEEIKNERQDKFRRDF